MAGRDAGGAGLGAGLGDPQPLERRAARSLTPVCTPPLGIVCSRREPSIHRLSLILAVLACVTALGVAGCGSSSSSSTATAAASSSTHFAKTKFLLHAGLAFGAFHRYIYKPFKSGDFRHPFLHKLTLIKAGLSALFIEHELRIAATDVRSSRILSALFSPLTAVASRISSLKSSITHGSVGSSGIDGVQSELSSISHTASSKGQSIQDALPSASQLASGG